MITSGFGRARLLPAILLVILLGLLPLRAWLDTGDDPIELDNRAAGLTSLTWAGTVAPDGRLAVEITYDFSDDVDHTLDIRVPDGARYLAVDGDPVSADIGKYASTTVSDSATVSYEVPGRIKRYRDGALLRLAAISDTTIDGDEALFPCPRCYIDGIDYGDAVLYGALFVSGAPTTTLSFVGLDGGRATADAGVIRFVGVDTGAEDVSMLAVIGSDAVPQVPVGDGSVATALDAAQGELGASGEKFTTIADDAKDQGPSSWTAITLTVMYIGIVVWMLSRFVLARRTAATTTSPADSDAGSHIAVVAPPSDLEPALVGAVVGESGPGSRSVVAATLLELTRRGVVSIDGPDPRRVTLEVPQGATGDTTFENAVLGSLRPTDDPLAAATRSGPPLWGAKGVAAARRLQVVLIRAASKQRLLAMILPVAVLVAWALAMAVVAIVGDTDGAGFEWFMVFAGPIIAFVAAFAAGITLTARGRHERTAWMEYASWLHDNPSMAQQLEQADAGPIDASLASLGVVLPYAAALGAAPGIATALSPRHGE